MSVAVDWFVQYGPDASHITYECDTFRRLKDARAFVEGLPEGRLWRILRAEYRSQLEPASRVTFHSSNYAGAGAEPNQ